MIAIAVRWALVQNNVSAETKQPFISLTEVPGAPIFKAGGKIINAEQRKLICKSHFNK